MIRHLRPKGKTKQEVTEDRSDKEVKAKKKYAPSVNGDGTWLKKQGEFHFGYKNILFKLRKACFRRCNNSKYY